jgi:hypothetical protein
LTETVEEESKSTEASEEEVKKPKEDDKEEVKKPKEDDKKAAEKVEVTKKNQKRQLKKQRLLLKRQLLVRLRKRMKEKHPIAFQCKIKRLRVKKVQVTKALKLLRVEK